MIKSNWLEIKTAYQNGEGSIRELAERFGVSLYALEARCKRGKWHKEKSEIVQKVSEKVVEQVADKATEHIKTTITLCDALYADIVRSREQLLPAIDPAALDALSRAFVRVNQVARESLGIPAPSKSVDIKSGSIDVNVDVVSILKKIREFRKSGMVLDVDREVEECKKLINSLED